MKLKKLFALALAAVMLALPVAAAEPSDWALSELTDGEALGMLSEEDMKGIQDTVTADKLNAICAVLDARLAAAGLEKKDAATAAAAPQGDVTRGDVMEHLYYTAASYALPADVLDAAWSPVEALQSWGVVNGYSDGSVQQERLCTLEEAVVMGSRCAAALIDRLGGGSQGLLWKAEKGESVVYLLGTIHVDRGNIYPFGRQLRGVLAEAQRVVFEVDFGNQEELMQFAALQTYSDGSKLSDHIDAELYQRVIDALEPYGYPEVIVSQLKPWVISNLFTSLQASSVEEGQADALMVIDMYVYSKSLAEGKEIGEIEGYMYQGQLFDTLSEEYQLAYLEQSVEVFEQSKAEAGVAGEVDAAYDELIGYWIGRDIDGFAKAYDKDAMSEVEDELNDRLFGERDDHMSAYVKEILDSGEKGTTLIVVGAGHMVGKTGIVNQLLEAGYTVAAVEAAQ